MFYTEVEVDRGGQTEEVGGDGQEGEQEDRIMDPGKSGSMGEYKDQKESDRHEE